MIRNGILSGFLCLAVAIGCATASPAKQRALAGSWGGRHIGLELTAEGGRVEYDCAHGTIDGPVVPDREGRFEAAGTHVAEHGGPVREGEEERGRPARYRGKVAGKTLKLTVTLVDSGEEIGAFTLTRGATPRLMKCL
jgi:hypothetical protein